MFRYIGNVTAFVLLVVLGFLSFPQQAETATLKFAGGGTCDVITQANGIRLDKCVNWSGFTVDDIHLVFSHPKLPGVTKDYENAFGCGIVTVCDFGKDVPNGGTWEGVTGSKGAVNNPTIWKPADIAGQQINLNMVKVGGYWTKGGKMIAPVPVPASVILLVTGFGFLMLSRIRRG